ncbi:HesA/MoeB/ThiF family protein [Saccharicrinis sp. 156]|uniref:HesA/MoeB/ThiF family protein n=1 Tax=Saccharicrinis sp. 156 TaxID=3417574 RepID=UPI003D34BE2F
MLSEKEHIRYQRQLILPQFGTEAQEKLKNAKVFVAGAGGLGAPVCYYLAAAGVGHLVVCDRDKVELSNLNRQILHSTKKIGTPKSDSAFDTLNTLNPEINIVPFNETIDNNSIAKMANSAHIMVDCLDNILTRRVLNRYSIKKNIPIMHAGIDGWNTQLTLINPPHTPCINCLFDDAKDSTEPKPVLGAVAGIAGTLQALETIKYIVGTNDISNTLIYLDSITLEFSKISIEKNKNCSVCGHL